MSRALLQYRRILIIAVHIALWTGAFTGAFLLRFEFDVPDEYIAGLPLWLPVLLALRSATFVYAGLFHGLWRYTGTRELTAILRATSLSTVAFVLFVVFAGLHVPRSIFILEWLLAVMSLGGLRMGIRTFREVLRQRSAPAGERVRILIVGAGDAGEMLLREIQKSKGARYQAIGFIDSSPSKRNETIHGVPVLGPVERVPALVKEHAIEEIIIAIPRATGREMRLIVDTCKPSGAKICTIPSLESLIDGRVTVSQIRSVAIEDLLGRLPVELDTALIAQLVQGSVVLITGAGGSIGSELCRQVLRFAPKQLLLIERAENNLFQIDRELSSQHAAGMIVPIVADICDEGRMEEVFERYRPTVVFHAAAHKHVPMMEWNPGEAIKNNVFGTKRLAELADRFSVRTFVMISTDKAVNPSSTMGASKRVAEIFVQALSLRSRTRFVTVRFGNVLGSTGSVIPIFKEQIASGGPVTVTHAEMKRYFMTITEACQLVLQAGAMGKGGEIFVLDMGEPVKIIDLARDLITLSGLRPGEDIEIRVTGVRPGEKLFEELSVAEEQADKTVHPKIFVGRLRPALGERIAAQLDDLATCLAQRDPALLRRKLSEIVPEYRASESLGAPAAQVAGVIPLRR